MRGPGPRDIHRFTSVLTDQTGQQVTVRTFVEDNGLGKGPGTRDDGVYRYTLYVDVVDADNHGISLRMVPLTHDPDKAALAAHRAAVRQARLLARENRLGVLFHV